MGKYMRKAKITREVAVMELASPGVKTRAKTLALQRLQKTQFADSSAYLQLRSRRLEKKVAPLVFGQSPKVGSGQKGDSRANSVSGGSKEEGEERKEATLEAGKEEEESVQQSFDDVGTEGSSGDNGIQGRDRSTRETTPCCPIRNPDVLRTPGSTTRPTNSAATNRRIQRTIPSGLDFNELFASAEEDQIRSFIEKYNFDPVTETPLPGRFEWERVSP